MRHCLPYSRRTSPPRCQYKLLVYLLQVAVAVMTDGTVAVEVASENALVQWPFLSDLTLIDAITKVFQLPQHLTEDLPNTHPQLGLPQVCSSPCFFLRS